MDTPVPAGGEISRCDDGSLNGELIDAAKNLVSPDLPPQRDVETRIADQVAEHARLHAAGLTSIRHPGGAPDQYELLAELKRRGEPRALDAPASSRTNRALWPRSKRWWTR